MEALRRWFLGTGEYAHPILRWLAGPLFRVVMVVFVTLLFLGEAGDGLTGWRIVGIVLLGLSGAADIVNALWLRSRRSAAKS